MRDAKSSTTSGQLDICSKMYPAQMSDEKSSSLYHCVIIHQTDGERRCVNWSAEKIVCITFLYIACKNM